MLLTTVNATSILTRTSGYLTTVASHSLQPYRGCALGNSLCGVGCYVRHSWYVTRGERWGAFVETRRNAAALYAEQYAAEQNWARKHRQRFVIFLSSATEPFQPMERKWRVTKSVLLAMCDQPPDGLILQSHSHHVADYVELYRRLVDRCDLRVHVSIESDRDCLPDLPPPASSVRKRMEAARLIRQAGVYTVITVSPLLPIADPPRFFAELSEVADAVVIDHFIGGDGSKNGSRTLRTALPQAMAQMQPESLDLNYRDEIVRQAGRHFHGPVGIGIDGFAGRYC
jgi:DNA repair photolyase